MTRLALRMRLPDAAAGTGTMPRGPDTDADTETDSRHLLGRAPEKEDLPEWDFHLAVRGIAVPHQYQSY